MPLQGEALQVISANLMGKNNTQNDSANNGGVGAEAQAETGGRESTEEAPATAPLASGGDASMAAAAAAAALAYYSGISFIRDSETLPAQGEGGEVEEEEDDFLDDDSSSDDEYVEDDEEYLLYDTMNNGECSGAGGGIGGNDPTITTDDNLTYRSDASGTSAGAGGPGTNTGGCASGKQGDLQHGAPSNGSGSLADG